MFRLSWEFFNLGLRPIDKTDHYPSYCVFTFEGRLSIVFQLSHITSSFNFGRLLRVFILCFLIHTIFLFLTWYRERVLVCTSVFSEDLRLNSLTVKTLLVSNLKRSRTQCGREGLLQPPGFLISSKIQIKTQLKGLKIFFYKKRRKFLTNETCRNN